MIELGPHAAYIVGAYAGVAALLAALIGWVAWDAHRVRQQLRALDARGIRRRSDSGGTAA